MTFKGDYSAGTSYSVGDVVIYTDKVVYLCQKTPPAGTPPVNTRYWGRLDQLLGDAAKLAADAAKLLGLTNLDVANNLTTEDAGSVLDARQGKALKDLIDSVLPTVTSTENGKVLGVADGAWGVVAPPGLPTVDSGDAGCGLCVSSEGEWAVTGGFAQLLNRVQSDCILLASSTPSSSKIMKITVVDDGTISAAEYVEPE